MYNLEIYPAESKHYPPFEQMMPAFYHFISILNRQISITWYNAKMEPLKVILLLENDE